MRNMTDAVKPIRFDADAEPDPSSPTTTKQWYSDPTGGFKSGFWASRPGRSEVNYQKDELCVILEGVVRLIDEAGHAETYRRGDTFLIPNGFKGVWETVEPTRKFHAIHRTAKN